VGGWLCYLLGTSIRKSTGIHSPTSGIPSNSPLNFCCLVNGRNGTGRELKGMEAGSARFVSFRKGKSR
jgi:hypothetical protein